MVCHLTYTICLEPFDVPRSVCPSHIWEGSSHIIATSMSQQQERAKSTLLRLWCDCLTQKRIRALGFERIRKPRSRPLAKAQIQLG